MRSTETLLDLIYEASVVPDQWAKVLHECAGLIDGVGGILFAQNGDEHKWIASEGIADLFHEFVMDGWAKINPRPVRLGALNHLGFVTDLDAFTPEELDNDPVYRDFYRKKGVGWATGTMIRVPSGDNLYFTLERAHAKGPVERPIVNFFDTLRPHLARSALLAWRLRLEEAKAMTRALAVVGLPAAVIGSTGRLLDVNDAFQPLIPGVVEDRSSGLHIAAEPGADRLLTQALAGLRRRGAAVAETVASIPLPARGERPPIIFHLIPIRGAAHDVFVSATAILVATPVVPRDVPGAEVLQGLFDLTPGEARVARAIGEQKSIDAMAAGFGVSRETVRTQVKAVLSKCGLSRQSQLASLLAGTQPLG
jgi:DNA-binding CsgD family transcriptional regulator